MSSRAEWACILFGCLLLNLTYAATQPVDRVTGPFGAGGRAYESMAANAIHGLPLQGVPPFGSRVGMPVLVSGLARARGWIILAGFNRLNIAFNLLSVVLLTLLLRRHIASVFARLAVLAAFMVEPHSPMRLSYFHPISVDPSTLAGLLAGIVGIGWFQEQPTLKRAVPLALLVAVGVAFHEAILIIGVCVLLTPLGGTRPGDALRPSRGRSRWEALERSGAWLPLVSGVAVLLAIHAWAATDDLTFAHLPHGLPGKSLARYLVSWCLVFGPFLAVPIYFWRRSLAFLDERPELLAYLAVFTVLAWAGASDAERLLAFGSPVVYILIANALTWSSFGPSTGPIGMLLLVQALSSRVFSPIGSREALLDTWQWLGSAAVASGLSFENMWSRSSSPAMLRCYLLWYSLTGSVVVALLWFRRRGRENGRERAPTGLDSAPAPAPARVIGSIERWSSATTLLGTATALLPVVWLAFSRFYWRQYAQPGPGYLGYNLVRLWTLVVLLAAFWATGSRLIRFRSAAGATSARGTSRFVEAAFCGAATWSVGVVLLAMSHLYYVWVILPLLAVAVAAAIRDLVAMYGAASSTAERPGAMPRWGLIGSLLRFFVVFNGLALLTIALWGNPGPDNDVPGTYLAYYESVLQAHWNGPNNYWVHFFVSKGNGLAFLANSLSDVQGAALASYLMLLLGATMIWRLAAPRASVAPPIGLVGVALYLQFYAEQGAYAKSHVIRNTLVLYLVLSFTRFMAFTESGARLDAVSRFSVIAAVVLLSPLAVVLLVPILLVEALFIALSRNAVEARRHLVYPAWALAATAFVCLYNFYEVGLLELHSMPSFMARFVDVARLGRWVDPRLAYVDDRLVFMQASLPWGEAADASTALKSMALPLTAVLPTLLNSAALTLAVGAAGIAALAGAFSRRSAPLPGSLRRADPARALDAFGDAPRLGAAYLCVILAMVSVLRMIGGGPGSSMGRFTDFTTPLGIAFGVLLITAAWALAMGRVQRVLLAVAISCVACAAMYLGAPPVLAQLWRPSIGFLVGDNSYAVMNDANWDTLTAVALARVVPAGERAEMLNFLPGFTAIPATPFQRPDGSASLRDYTQLLYGSEEQAAAVYRAAKTNYFLFDVSGQSPVVWSGFSALFSPESIRSRMRLVAHDLSQTKRYDLYLLSWNRGDGSGDSAAFETFLEQWGALRATERQSGQYRPGYDAGARQFGAAQPGPLK